MPPSQNKKPPMSIAYRCPLCSSPLALHGNSLRCERGHSFDISKEGYVNLVPVQNKRSKAPGDNAEMIQARRRFLNKKHYQPFLDKIIKLIEANKLSSPQSMIDIGCGEGWYSDSVARHFRIEDAHAIDLSKPAVKSTAKAYRNLNCSVASAYSLPYFDSSFDLAINIFSPLDAIETARILKPNALLIVAGPAPEHLKALAECIYDVFTPHQESASVFEGFEQLGKTSIQNPMSLAGQDIPDLLAMTPYYWSCSKEKQNRIAELAALDVTAEFTISYYRNIKE